MARERRQYVRFTFYHLDPGWRRLPANDRASGEAELAGIIDGWTDRILIRTYSTIGTRGDCDLLVWQVSENLDDFQALASDVVSSGMGSYMQIPYSYLSMTKHSMYVSEHEHAGQEGTRLTIAPGGARYLFVYPFVKTRGWYLQPQPERQRMMSLHIAMGHKYPTVKINTTYSFGLDDQEFVLAFETDYPGDFLDLVQELRETEASSYTLRDTPIFTCVTTPIREILRSLHSGASEMALSAR
ncbi:MAG: cld [Chloroflexi bacterium]|nr:cld [Chloroflexota bacterium]